MPSLILGTAGHIDHGKSTLVRALTGVDPDRLPEEKQRGITIELGFAPLDLGDGLTLGVVDVPGHEGLVRTMVAGASGIDLLLLVIAADEGVMPQTREHLAICDLLGLERAVVALTKTDLAEGDVAELAQEEAREALEATRLAGAPIIPVSAQTGDGLDALRATLRELATDGPAATPRTGPARLGVDRVFVMRGFGTVVTGSLLGSALRVGDAVEVQPDGLRARVRGLQQFGESVEQAEPGSRCAINLQGVERAQLARGQVVCRADALPTSDTFDATLAWLPEAPELGREPTAVEILVGTAERRGRVALVGAERLAPGEEGLARIHVDGPPLALLPGDRFVLRGFARLAGGGSTLGGGRVLDVAPPRRRRSDPQLVDELARLAAAPLGEALRLRVARAGLAGIEEGALARETGRTPEQVAEQLTDEGSVVHAGKRWLATASLETLEGRLVDALSEFHDREPLRLGMSRSALAGALPDNAPAEAFEAALARLCADGRAEIDADLVRAGDFVPRLTQRQEAIAARLRADAMIDGLEPKSVREQLDELGIEEGELRDVLAHLARDGSLTRTPADLWFDKGAVDELRERVIGHLREHDALDTTAYKALIGTTRKWAVPLMELFDEEHLTVRRGDARVRGRAFPKDPA